MVEMSVKGEVKKVRSGKSAKGLDWANGRIECSTVEDKKVRLNFFAFGDIAGRCGTELHEGDIVTLKLMPTNSKDTNGNWTISFQVLEIGEIHLGDDATDFENFDLPFGN